MCAIGKLIPHTFSHYADHPAPVDRVTRCDRIKKIMPPNPGFKKTG